MSGRKKKKPAIASESPAAEAKAAGAAPKVAETKPAETKVVEAKAVEAKAVEAKAVEAKSVETKSAATKPAETKSAGAKSADGKTAQAKKAEPKATPLARRRKRAATELETRIGYHFNDAAMLESALTHISALRGGNRANSYQRLEFLGDHVLGLVISDMLYRAYLKADEGELSRRLADLVRKETCYEIARAIDLGAALRVGSSEANAGARSRIAILADVCEALIGAVYLDGGYKAAEGLVERLWEVRLKATAPPLRDPKTVLQEWAQARGLPTPVYREIARSGPDHNPEFRVAVQLPALAPAEGSGRSKRAAEQGAAAAMLAREGVRSAQPNG
ncbi:MAG: ribonuclease III [Xanthobacteraceae bacterium]